MESKSPAMTETQTHDALHIGDHHSLNDQMIDLLEKFEQTGEQFMLARCVELFREGLGSGFAHPDEMDAQSKEVNKAEAFQALEMSLGQYTDALRQMESAKNKYESEAAAYKQSLSSVDLHQSTKSPTEIQQELEVKLKLLSNLEDQRAQLQQTLAEEGSSCEQLQQEVEDLRKKKAVTAQATTISAAHASAEQSLQQTQHAVARVKELIQTTDFFSDFTVCMEGLSHTIAGKTERLQIQSPKIHFTLTFSPADGPLTAIDVTYGEQHILPEVVRDILKDAQQLEPPNDLRLALTMMRAASEADSFVQEHKQQLAQSHIVGDHNGDVVVSFRNGISVHFCTHYAYPTVPAGVHVTHISGVGFSDEDLSLLASQINTAAYSTLVDAAAHIENACK